MGSIGAGALCVSWHFVEIYTHGTGGSNHRLQPVLAVLHNTELFYFWRGSFYICAEY